jgi:transcriptional regulator with XRE-family HTH domain
MAPVDDETLGGLIRAHRLQRGWTQEHLAEIVGVRQAQMSGYELGKVHRPDPSVLARLDDAFGLVRGTLLGMAGWKGAKPLIDAAPKAGAIVIEDASPELEHLIDIVARLEPETVQRIAESATVEYRTEVDAGGADDEAEAS